MNKELRIQYKIHRWSVKEALLQYFRIKNCYQSLTKEPNANPYWYGTVLDFDKFGVELEKLTKEKSIRIKRLSELLLLCVEDHLSPIVRLTGIYGLNLLKIWGDID